MGGMVSAIEQGFVQREIQDAAYRTQRAIEGGEAEVVGVNIHRLEEEPPSETMSIDPNLEERQVARLQALRSRRDSAAAQAAIDALRRAAEGDENLLPHVLHGVESLCSLGEISDALREVFGLHREVVVL